MQSIKVAKKQKNRGIKEHDEKFIYPYTNSI